MSRSVSTRARRSLAIPLALLALALLAVIAPAAGAETIVVSTAADTTGGSCTPTNGDCSLREALELIEAGETEATVEIELTATGTIDIGEKGELELDFPEEVETVEINGPGAAQLTISGGGESRVFRIDSETSVLLTGMTIANGAVTGAAIDGDGGAGILVEESEGVRLEDVRLTENRVESDRSGGAVAIEEGVLEIEAEPLEIIASRLDHNFSETGGGAIYADSESTVTVIDSELDHNEAEEEAGGAILVASGELNVESSTLAENSAGDPGAGIALTEAEPLLLRNSTVSANEGGGVYAVGGLLTIRNSTIVDNSGGPGVEAEFFVIQSSILSGNESGSAPADCAGTAASQGNNLVGSTAGCSWTAGAGDLFGLDPELGPLGDYGGPTATMPPVSRESPAINAGENPQASDQRGRARPVPGTAADTDIGAVEVQAPVLELDHPPEISPFDELKTGDTLVCEPGEWNTDTVTDPSITYAWRVDGAVAASGVAYELENDDAGKLIACEVTVDNGVLAASAESGPVELAPALAVIEPPELEFEPRRVGAGPSEPQALVLSNQGGAELEVTAALTTNPEFPIDAAECVGAELGRDESCVIEAAFAPAAPS